MSNCAKYRRISRIAALMAFWHIAAYPPSAITGRTILAAVHLQVEAVNPPIATCTLLLRTATIWLKWRISVVDPEYLNSAAPD
jgi:hypothetical protein